MTDWYARIDGLLNPTRDLDTLAREMAQRCAVLERDNERLREAIEAAPCPGYRHKSKSLGGVVIYCTLPPMSEKCDCWKRAALTTELDLMGKEW